MKSSELFNLLKRPEYNFLRENEHLGKNLLFVTLGGSYAYGTNTDHSDIDIRGCALNRPCDILGLENFEQVVDNTTDTTIYSFNKLISLILNCNPNTIEMLGGLPEHYRFYNILAVELINNRRMFLSKRAIYSFGGYATQQLRRLENAIARDRMEQARKEEHILHSMEGAVKTFKDRYTQFAAGSVNLYTDVSDKEELDKEIFLDINLNRYPAREFNGMLNDLKNVLDTYEHLNHRNSKKDDEHLNKHAMHLVRLYLTCFDILEKEEIITYRKDDHNLLMSIRNGKYQNEDGSYKSEFFDMINEYDKRLQYDKEHTNLPEHPNMKLVQEFVMDMNLRSLIR